MFDSAKLTLVETIISVQCIRHNKTNASSGKGIIERKSENYMVKTNAAFTLKRFWRL